MNIDSENVKAALKVAFVNLIFQLLLWPVAFFTIPPVVSRLAAVFLASVALFVVSICSLALGMLLTALFVWALQIPAVVMSGDFILWGIYFAFIIVGAFVLYRARDAGARLKRAALLLVLWFVLAHLYHRFPYKYVIAPELAVMTVLSFLAMRKGLKLFERYKPAAVFLALAALTLTAGLTSYMSLRYSSPAPLHSLIVDSQRGVDVVLPAHKLPAGVRVFIPTDEGYLVQLVYPYRIPLFLTVHPYNDTQLALLDEGGRIIRPPLFVSERLDNIERSPDDPNIFYVPSLLGHSLCALDIREWELKACSEPTDRQMRVALSPSGRLAATTFDYPQPVYVFRTDDLSTASRYYSEDSPCLGVGMRFVDDHRLLVGCYSGLFDVRSYLVELDISQSEARSIAKAFLPTFSEVMEIVPSQTDGEFIVLDFNTGWTFVYNIANNRLEKGAFVFPAIRALKRIETRDMWCAVSEFGLVALLDSSMDVVKTIYCGSNAKNIYVHGNKLYIASKAGLVEIDLDEVMAE
ncbi:MAG TPA: hypothetical protein ENF73_00905 [Proteobacteria bacterium]|nr:hypothetical protein [Pseudomonadota bacterium]